MCYPNDSSALSVFVANQKPGGDQRINESQLLWRFRHVGVRRWASRNCVVAETNRGEAAQHGRQCILDVRGQCVYDYVGAPGNRAFQAAQRTICGEGEQSALSTGFVECV